MQCAWRASRVLSWVCLAPLIVGRTDEGDDLSEQIILAQWFGQISPDATKPHLEPVKQTNAPRKHDEGNRLEPWVLFKLERDLEPIQTRHHQIQQDKIGQSHIRSV